MNTSFASLPIAILVALLTGPPAWCGETWTVASAIEQRADFRSIQEAVDAAAPGDVLVVLDDVHGGFVLDKRLTVLGPGTVPLQAHANAQQSNVHIIIENLPPGPPAIVVDANATWVTVRNCDAAVLLGNLSVTRRISVTDSVDVRMRRVSGGPRLSVARSRVEAEDSTFSGDPGWQPDEPDGTEAVEVEPESRVHLSRVRALGGPGADAWIYSEEAGDGGAGILFEGSAAGETALIVAGGNASRVEGGRGGRDYLSQLHGCGGDGLLAEAELTLHSQTVFLGGASTLSYCDGDPIVGPAELLQPPAPTLAMSGTPQPGQLLDFNLRARDGALATVLHGTNPVVVRDPAVLIERLVDARPLGLLGRVQQDNELDFTWRVPPSAKAGDLFLLQAEVLLSSGLVQRTNSVLVVVR